MEMETQYAARVESLLEIQRHGDAISECLKGLNAFPDSFYLQSLLVRAHVGADNNDEAERTCRQLVQQNPQKAFGYFLFSIVCHNQKKFSSELRMAEEAVKIEPDDADYLKRLAEAQMQNGQLKKAKLSCEQMLKLVPDEAESYELCGRIALEFEDYSKAEEYFRHALRLEPDDISNLNSLAITLRGQKREEEAIDILFAALKQRANNPVLKENLFEFIKVHLDRKSLGGKRQQALKNLPSAVQVFYRDYRKRIHIFERHSNYVMAIFWLAAIAAMAFIFGSVKS